MPCGARGFSPSGIGSQWSQEIITFAAGGRTKDIAENGMLCGISVRAGEPAFHSFGDIVLRLHLRSLKIDRRMPAAGVRADTSAFMQAKRTACDPPTNEANLTEGDQRYSC